MYPQDTDENFGAKFLLFLLFPGQNFTDTSIELSVVSSYSESRI